MPTATDYIKYAGLQLAADAFLLEGSTRNFTGADLERALIRGNDHISRFTPTHAAAFAVEWEVLDRRSTIRSR